jgi:ATP-binding cassette subfamily B protein
VFGGEFDRMKGAESVRSGVRHALNIRRAVRLVWQSAPRWMLASVAFVFVQGLLPLLALRLMKLVVDAETAAVTTHGKRAAFGHVALLIALAGGVVLVSSLCRILAGLVSEVQAQAVSTVRQADCIYVMDQNRIIESGDHDTLMRLGGRYARLFELQARNYR